MPGAEWVTGRSGYGVAGRGYGYRPIPGRPIARTAVRRGVYRGVAYGAAAGAVAAGAYGYYGGLQQRLLSGRVRQYGLPAAISLLKGNRSRRLASSNACSRRPFNGGCKPKLPEINFSAR